MYATQKISDPNRKATADRITAAIGIREHIKRNYVPWALTNLALAELEMHLKESARFRLRSIKLSDRRLRALMKEYSRRAAAVCGDSAPDMDALLADFHDASKAERFLMQHKAQEDALSDEDCLEPDQGLHGAIALDLLLVAKEIDDDTDDLLTKIMRTPVTRHTEPELVEIRKILRDYRRRGYAPELSAEGHDYIKAIVRKALNRADELIDIDLAAGNILGYPDSPTTKPQQSNG